MTANVNRMWRHNAKKLGGIFDKATNVIQLKPHELPDLDPNESDEQIRERLRRRFEIVRGMAVDCTEQKVRGLILSGPGGVGKTHGVDEVMTEWDPEGHMWKVKKGKMKATGLYKQLYERRFPGNITILDDCDTVWNDQDSLNFIKIATDTLKKGKPRVLSYAAEFDMVDSEGELIPREFEYEGTMIFCTNVDLDLQVERGTKISQDVEAIITRCHYVNLAMRTKRDYLVRIFDVADQGLFDDLELEPKEVDEVLAFIGEYYQHFRELSLRMALKVASLYKNDSAAGNWKDVAMVTCMRGMG